MRRAQVYPPFLAVGLALFVACTLGFDLYARTSIGGQGLSHAFSEHVHYAKLQLVGTLLLLMPFIGLAALGAEFWIRRGPGRSAAAFGAAALVLIFLYGDGYISSQQAMLHRKWTAATLAIGLLPFESVVAFVVGLIIGASGKRRDVQTK